MDCSPPGPSVQGFLQARTLECLVMPSSPGDLPYTGIKPTFSINFFLFWYKIALFKNHTLFCYFTLKNETHLFKSPIFSTGILIPYSIPLYWSSPIIYCYSTRSSLSSAKIKTNSKKSHPQFQEILTSLSRYLYYKRELLCLDFSLSNYNFYSRPKLKVTSSIKISFCPSTVKNKVSDSKYFVYISFTFIVLELTGINLSPIKDYLMNRWINECHNIFASPLKRNAFFALLVTRTLWSVQVPRLQSP